ncbi:MAG: Rne/Rng family ribonuclease [Candidatus Rokubacteria bacterium]|nr:Rne/Rng family ribonuclease [Candidatus Rokubacteria bacterium]
MQKKIFVNVGPTETRVALLEENLLTELYVERHRTRSIVGNICKGVVTNVLPGMQAAFVDIGLGKDAFLYGGDFISHVQEYERMMVAGEEGEEPEIEMEEAEPRDRREISPVPIQDLLRKGQEILVQVSKESLGTKGARVTSFVSLPGRSLVYMPQVNHVGVSRRIRDGIERDRLRKLVKQLRTAPGGYIIRTVADGKGEEEFHADMEFLTRHWGEIQARYAQAPAPSVLHEEMDLTFRVIRDLFSPDVEEFVVDDEEAYRKCQEFAKALVPALADRVTLYTAREPLFEARGIEGELDKVLRRKVWLKSGGYIVIDQTEALVAIDVNTGKYVGKRDFEQTILKINLEAVKEIVRQIRLRDLGGIIILDFIDMDREDHRQQVWKALRKALAADKARTHVLPISELGIVEMTRKRVRQDLLSLLTEKCPSCKGTGGVRSPATIAADLLRRVQVKAVESASHEIVIRLHHEVAAYLQAEERNALERLQSRLDRKITLEPISNGSRDTHEILFR